MSSLRLERRVEALEAKVEQLTAKVEGAENGARPWWDQMCGAFAGDAAFQEAMKLGRHYRESQRPKRPASKKR
jgi:hypothetical protein